MVKRLYLRHGLSTLPGRPTDTEATDAVDTGDNGANRLLCLVMSAKPGGPCGGQHAEEWQTITVNDDVDVYLRPWISRPFAAAQTLAAGSNFTIAGAWKGNLPNNPGYGELRGFAYLWRPGVGYVATLSQASSSSRALTTTATRTNDALETFFVIACPALGGDVEAQAGDRLVCELWAHFHRDEAGEGATGTYHAYWDGRYAVADGETTTSAAAYIEYSENLSLEGEMEATNILVGARDIEVDSVTLGALDGGVDYKYEATVLEHEVDQRLGIVAADKTRERVTVTCHVKEPTLENLRIAMSQETYQLSLSGTATVLNFGGARAMPTHEVSITGKAPGTDKTRTLVLRSAIVIDSGSHSYVKGAATIYDVTFLCIEDADMGVGFRYGYFKDESGEFSFV